jgi:hypothetical protein
LWGIDKPLERREAGVKISEAFLVTTSRISIISARGQTSFIAVEEDTEPVQRGELELTLPIFSLPHTR